MIIGTAGHIDHGKTASHFMERILICPAWGANGCGCKSSRGCRHRSSLWQLQSLSRTNEVALDGAWVRLPGHEVRLTGAEETLWLHVEPLIVGTQRFRPPRVRDIGYMIGVDEAAVRRLLKLLGRLGKVDPVAHDHFFLRGSVAEMVEIAVDLAAKAPNGQFTAAEFRDRLDNGRKVAIQISSATV